MRKLYLFLSVFCLVSFPACNNNDPAPPTPKPTVSVTPKPSPTVSVTPSPSPTVSPSPSPTASGPVASDLFTATAATHASVDKYVLGFYAEGVMQGLNMKSLFGAPKLKINIGSLDNLGAGVIGLCESGGGSRTVTFDPDFFGQVDDLQNQELVWHELGHCILDRPHRGDIGVIPDGLGHTHEMSIMYPVIFGALQYQTHMPYYNNELYTELATDNTPKVYICH